MIRLKNSSISINLHEMVNELNVNHFRFLDKSYFNG